MFNRLLAAQVLFAVTLATPIAVERRQSASASDAPAVTVVPTATAVGPPGADASVVPPGQYELAAGQDADKDLGLFLDLSTVEHPLILALATSLSIGRTATPSRLLVPMLVLCRTNIDALPIATAMAGVDMRLSPNAYREMHWHKANEWSIILNGSVRLNSMNEAGETFVDHLQAGDVWFFPAGIPHSIQASEAGVEFRLVFDSGDFSEDGTNLLSETFERNPKAVLAKDLRVDTSAFDKILDGELYIFDGTPFPKNISTDNITGPAGVLPQTSTYSYHLSQQAAYEVPGGSVKIIDPLSFPIASNFAAALFTVKPGAMRELHWHTTSDEWNYIISGQGRLTVYSAPASSRTFDFQAGDVGYVPVPASHYLENTGTEDLVYLEVLQAPAYNDISVAQWLGLTPKRVVKDHLGFSDDTLARLPKIKPYILPGSTNLTQTNFTSESE
ncbi:hypothetical protein LTR95_003755 [Oleoguttula sp. CCFEE 5521]